MMFVVRADGNSDIGYGHLVRTSALASVFLSNGHEVRYTTATPSEARDVLPGEIDIHRLDSFDDPEPFIEYLRDVRPAVVLADSYQVDTAYQQAVHRVAPALGVVLDDTRFQVCADIVINGNLGAEELEYEWVGEEPKWCLGTDYTLLRQSISERARRESPWRNPPKRAIVTMGGSDINGATPTAMRLFDGTDVRVDVIIGPGFSSGNKDRIYRCARTLDASFDVHHEPENMAKLLFQADVAVSALGSTTYELLALQTPFVGVPQVDNQRPIARALRARDAALVVDDGGLEDGSARDAVEELLSDAELRRTLRERGRELVDGEGTHRLYRELLGSSASTNSHE